MSLVSKEALDYIKEKRAAATKGGMTYESAYNQALRGLEAAIALLNQINDNTQCLSIETKITLSKN